MWKTVALLLVVLGIALYYTYVADPCQSQIRAEFADKHPDYEILHSAANEGSPKSVRCLISYQKPGSDQTHEEIWLYLYSKTGWKFGRVLEAPRGP